MAEEGKKYVPEGVLLVCDKGSIVSQLFATPRKVTLYGTLITTDHDNVFEQNIIPFGSCKKLGECAFAKVQWTMVKEGPVFVNSEKPLLEHSEALCETGDGKIKIYFDEYEANLANENNNESDFVKEDITSYMLGHLLVGPAAPVIDLITGKKFTKGVGTGGKKGIEGSYNFFRHDIWKADTWKGMAKMSVIGGVYTSFWGPIAGDTVLSYMDSLFGSDFVETRDAVGNAAEKFVDNAIEDVKRGNWEEVGENLGQAEYMVIEAIAGSKGAGIIAKGLTTTAKTLIGAERLAQIAAKTALFMNKLKIGILGIVRVGKKFNFIDEAVKYADELMKTMSLSKRGPVLSAIYDPKTGKTFFGTNFNMRKAADRLEFEKFKENLHPLLKKRLENHNLFDHTGKAGTPGAHSEIRALDEALKAREAATGTKVTEADLSDFQLHNRGMTNHAPNVPVPRCPHCAALTEGVTTK